MGLRYPGNRGEGKASREVVTTESMRRNLVTQQDLLKVKGIFHVNWQFPFNRRSSRVHPKWRNVCT